MHTLISLAVLNDIEIWTGDIRNDYLTAHTTEKVFFNTGPKFSPFIHTDHLLLIKTSPYGLTISGARFHSRLSDALTTLGFVPSVVGFYIWIRDEWGYYSYMAYYCDDLIVVHKYPGHVFDSILGKGFTIKETYVPEYFLGGNFERVKEPKYDN